MKVFTNLQTLPSFKRAVITTGLFDGVHCGHQQIIQQLKQEANKIGGETVIITFHPHPRKIISSAPCNIKLLSTLNEKQFLLKNAGINYLVIVPFTHAFANLSPEEYIKNFLVKHFHPHTIITGYNHYFGKDRKGDYRLLEQKGQEFNFVVKEIPEHIIAETQISSTNIRRFLSESKIAEANNLLGYDYFFEGLIVEGNKLGRTIGFPTANVHIEDEEKLIPANGVYAVKLQITNCRLQINKSQVFLGMMNIGVRPTINRNKQTIEVNIFNFNEDIYGQTLHVQIHSFIRNEIKFNGLNELKAQLQKDKDTAIKMLN